MTEAATQTANPFLLLADLKLTELPRLATDWPGQGGQFAGLVCGENGAPDYLLILGPECENEMPWQKAMDWAAGIEVDGHKDFTLPTRAEQAVLFGNTRDQFDEGGVFWSCEQHAEYADYAWVQGFGNGYQSSLRKVGEWRARAVRRLIIQ